MVKTRTIGISLAVMGAAVLSLPAVTLAAADKASSRPSTRPSTRPDGQKRLDALFAGGVPRSVADLKAMEDRFRHVAAKVTPATVAVRSGGGGGSGVIVSKDGYVLTVGHVTREAGRDVTLYLADGRRVRAKTLGANLGVDSGLIRITDKPPKGQGWPHRPMGRSASLKRGQWCLTIGHAGGYRRERTPPVRVGRVLASMPGAIATDCTIVSGDSGGPLFDMDGRVIGISSRIAGPLDGNIHVPVDTFRRDWDRLVKGEVFGVPRGHGAYLGVAIDPDAKDARIARVIPGSAAEKAGVRAGDVVTRFDGRKVDNRTTLLRLIAQKRPGNRVRITVQRDGKAVNLTAVLGRRGS